MKVRQGSNKRFGKSAYLSWILENDAPFSPKTKVYTLPSIEYDFWMTMKNSETGYLGLPSKERQAGMYLHFSSHES